MEYSDLLSVLENRYYHMMDPEESARSAGVTVSEAEHYIKYTIGLKNFKEIKKVYLDQ